MEVSAVNKDYNTMENSSKINKNDPSIYDRIFNEYGYGKEMWKIIFAIFLMYLVGSYATTNFSTMSIAFKESLKLSDNDMSLIGMIFFISKALGSLFTPFIGKLCSRITITNISYILLIILTMISRIYNNYSFFLLTRIISGYISGVFNVIANNILCEYLPVHFRSFYLNSVWIGFSLSQILNGLIMLYTMPEMQIEGIENTNSIYGLILLISFIFSLVFLRDSPRNLILNQENEKAFKILYKFREKEFFKEEIKIRIINEINGGANKDNQSHQHTFEIFDKNYLFFTFCVNFINLGMNIFIDGGNLLLNFVLKEVNIENNEEPVGNIVKSNIILNTANLLSNFVFAYLTEIESLGRKKTICLGLIVLSVSIIPVISIPKNITFYLTIFNFLTNVSILVSSYASEVYPTRIRDIGMGWMFGIGYIGSAISQYIVIYLFNINWRVPYSFMMIISILCSIVICMSPIETYQRPLDMKIVESEDEKELKEFLD